MKALLAGESVEYHGMTNRLDFAGSDGGKGVPVLMAASGPRSLEMAGEVADGALALVGYTPGIVEKVFEHLEIGARRSGRTLDDLEIMFAGADLRGRFQRGSTAHGPTGVSALGPDVGRAQLAALFGV